MSAGQNPVNEYNEYVIVVDGKKVSVYANKNCDKIAVLMTLFGCVNMIYDKTAVGQNNRIVSERLDGRSIRKILDVTG